MNFNKIKLYLHCYLIWKNILIIFLNIKLKHEIKIIMKVKDFEYIEIKFEYKDQMIIMKAEPFRTLDYIFEKAIIKMKKIILIPNNIKFYYLGKELNSKNSDKIGNIFNHKEKVTIKLKTPQKDNDLIIPKNNIIIFLI